MAKLISDAGEMQVAISRIECENDTLVVIGQMGVWRSRVIVPADELWAMVPGAPKIGFVRLLLLGALRALTRRKTVNS